MYPDFETRMMWKEYTGLPMNITIDDGYAYDFQQLPFKQVGFQMDPDEDLNKDNWNAMGMDGALCDPGIAELKRKADEIIAQNDRRLFVSKGEKRWHLSSFFKRSHPELPSNIWILAKDEDRPRGPRMRIQRNKSDTPQVEDAFWMSIADAPETIGPLGVELSAQDIDYLKNFIVRNKAVLLAHWNGEIGSEEVVRGLVF